MDYEKKYNEALKKARRLYEGKDKAPEEPILEYLFPELAESEDERIRKEAISIVKSYMNICEKEGDPCLSGYKVLAYLEKQKEQREIPLMNGDADLYFDNWVQHNDTTKRGCFEEGIRYAQRLQKEQDWNKKPCLTCQEYEKGHKQGYTEGCTAGYNKAMKEVEQKEQKPVEYLDKDKVYAIMTKLTNLSYSQLIPINSDEFKKLHEITSDVRSLLDYPTWKPSEEQMDRLFSIVAALRKDYCDDMADFLASLYKQLKKLM